MTDYRVPRAKSFRLTAEAYRLDAEANRLFGYQFEQFAAGAIKLAEDYDRMADDMEAEIAADERQASLSKDFP